MKTLPEPLLTILTTLFNVESFGAGWVRDLKNSLNAVPGWPELFKKQFQDLILSDSITVEEYKAITNHSFSNKKYLNDFLREKWLLYYKYSLTDIKNIKNSQYFDKSAH